MIVKVLHDNGTGANEDVATLLATAGGHGDAVSCLAKDDARQPHAPATGLRATIPMWPQ